MDKKEQARLRMQRMRNKQRNTTEQYVTPIAPSVTPVGEVVTQDVTLYKSKFLTPEQVKEGDVAMANAFRTMSGMRRQDWKGWANRPPFIPSSKDTQGTLARLRRTTMDIELK